MRLYKPFQHFDVFTGTVWPALLPVGFDLDAWEVSSYVWGLGPNEAVPHSRLIHACPGYQAGVVVDPAELAAWVGRAREAFTLGVDWRVE